MSLGLVLGLLACGILREAPSSLRAVDWVVPAPSGDWIALGGPGRFRLARRRVSLLNLATGEFFRAGYQISPGEALPVLSPDGKTAAWSRSRPTLRGETVHAVITRALGPAGPGRTARDPAVLGEAPLILFSGDGRRLALLTAESLFLRDRQTGRLVLEARPREPFWLWGSRGFTTATFVSPDVLRVYRVRASEISSRESVLDILELDAGTPRFSPVGRAGPFEGVFPILADSTRERLLVRETAKRILLLDGKNGKTIRDFSGGTAAARIADFLSDGRIALFETERAQVHLALLDRTGREETRIPLGPGERAFFVGEPAPGSIDVAVAFAAALSSHDARIVRVNTALGTAETIADHLFPVTTFCRWTCGDPGRSFAPGSRATRLFYGP
ncbi:MAG: hypothetical protein ACRD16_04335, partial [Thermoanaerobaculia bacterium]